MRSKLYQHGTRIKTGISKPAIATKILLTRDPYEMRQLGAETGNSEEWEAIVEDVNDVRRHGHATKVHPEPGPTRKHSAGRNHA